MSWISVSRFFKTEKNSNEVQRVVDNVANHWLSVAQDLGYDPDDNVTVQESEKMFNIAISEELDSTMREGPGDWW